MTFKGSAKVEYAKDLAKITVKLRLFANASNLFLIGKPPNLRIAKLFTTFVRYYERISKNIYGRRGKAAFRALLRIPRALA